MIKRIALLTVIFTLSLSAPALAAEPGNGVIEGQVVNVTEGGSSTAGQEVTLKTFLNENELEPITATTDAEGRFIFSGLSTEPGYSYQATLTFQQADYSGDQVSFGEGETGKFTQVTVYDSTTDSEVVKVMMSHTVIYVEAGALSVIEYFLFVNDSDRTYIGGKEIAADGTREVTRFALPGEATDLQYQLGLMSCCVYGSEGGFVESMPLLPGGKEVAYSYQIAYDSGEYVFSQKMNYPTMSYDFLIQGEATRAESDQLTQAEPINIEGTPFNHLSGEALAPGNTIVARISGLPQPANSQGVTLWVALTLAVLTGGFGFSYMLRKRKPQPVRSGDSPDQRKQKLLVELAQLDDDFEAGKLPEEVYRRLRTGKKSQLVQLMQGSKGERADR